MAPDGFVYLLRSLGTGLIFWVVGSILQNNIFYALGIISAVLALFFGFFFRDPERESDAGPDDIISPADGHVVAVEDDEHEFFGSKTKRISIFLSVFDVHINRIPISGKIEYLKYSAGSFLAAFKEEASEKNEQTAIGISSNNRKVLFKQIAGLIARRIVCDLKEDQIVERGSRCGMIKFSSRVDVFVPIDTEILVKKRQKVYGGKTSLGRFK
ncbi:phosphatidylserine decarboxylase family protein [candidate division KSB1 bacterium]